MVSVDSSNIIIAIVLHDIERLFRYDLVRPVQIKSDYYLKCFFLLFREKYNAYANISKSLEKYRLAHPSVSRVKTSGALSAKENLPSQ